MKKLLWFAALFAAVAASAQEVEKTTFLYAVEGSDSLRVDRYRVQGERAEPAPCLVFVFGGGFVWGSRDDASYLPFFEYMARRGFTVASIDYRLGLRAAYEAGTLDERTFPAAFPASIETAAEDLYSATAYLLAHADEWGIDPRRIVACGSSAGAITVLQAEYGLCAGAEAAGKLPAVFNYGGVIAFAGALFAVGDDLAWGTARTPAPMLLFHGDADRNVPYGAVRAMGAGFFGSEYIAAQLTEMGVPHAFYSVANAGHEIAVSPMNENRFEIDSFLEKLVFQRLPLRIDTRIAALDKPDVPKAFTLGEYIEANFGGR